MEACRELLVYKLVLDEFVLYVWRNMVHMLRVTTIHTDMWLHCLSLCLEVHRLGQERKFLLLLVQLMGGHGLVHAVDQRNLIVKCYLVR